VIFFDVLELSRLTSNSKKRQKLNFTSSEWKVGKVSYDRNLKQISGDGEDAKDM